jgi:hypothetical protein
MKTAGSGTSRNPAKMRQVAAFHDSLNRLRPWQEEAATAAVLTFIADNRLRAGHYREVASYLRQIGRSDPELRAQQAAGIAGFMLGNLAAGREATDYGGGWDHVVGPDDEPLVPRTTRRHYQDVWHWLRESLQYDLDLAALVNGGRSKVAARRWLERHPGKHAKDAPRPRKRAA